jgi:hypothetical protein
LQPPGQRVAIIVGGFENFSTGNRSTVQLAPLEELKDELTSYVRMLMDMLSVYSLVNLFILPPLFRSFPTWYSSTYESFLPQFLSDVSHVNPDRVKVVPPLTVNALDLEYDGVHLKPAALQRVLDLLLTTFRDGAIVWPADFPVSEVLRKLEDFFFIWDWVLLPLRELALYESRSCSVAHLYRSLTDEI